MKVISLLILFLLVSLVTLAQQGSVKGSLVDTASKKPVTGATVTVLQAKDSSLVSFQLSDDNGRFEVNKLVNGQYRLLITHVNYHNASVPFSINDTSKNKELGNVILNDLTKMLQEVIVTAEAPPVTLIDDTVQYNAGSFKTPPNATVEQLLKKLPGVKVEKDGTVKAQGQTVKKVLVDGKEFFGNDPKVATKNLPADAIDKVQVYDKSSDAAELTGFDDGNSEKTINLKLKKDKKKGMFGKVTAGGGTDGRYEGRFNVNSFKGARQLSVIGTANNTNAEGFSYMDMLSFSSQGMKGGGGGMTLAIDPGNGSNNNNDNGIRTIGGGGINYNNIIGNKTDFTSNYFYNRYSPKTATNTERQYFLPDSTYYYNQRSVTDVVNNSHKLNLSADIKLDSFHSIKISPSFGYQQSRNRNEKDYQTLSEENFLSNKGFSETDTYNEGFNFRNDLLFRKKWRKKGRTLSFNLQTNLNESDGDGSQYSVNDFYKQGAGLIKTDTIHQQNTNSSDLRGYTGKIVYTEPLFKRSLLELSTSKSETRNLSNKVTYDYNKLNGKFDQVNQQLTNDYSNTYGYTNAGVRLLTKFSKMDLAFGTNWQKAELDGKITAGNKDSTLNQTFYNVLPSARLRYKFSQFRTLQLNYTTSTNQPSLSQLQPVADISDPLNIKEGNPDLKQEFTHSMQLMFMSVNPFQGKNLFAFLLAQRTENKIVNYDTVNELGIKTTRPVNVDAAYNITGDVRLELPLRFMKSSVNIGSSISYSKAKQFINGAPNNIGTLSLGPDLRLSVNPTDKLDLSFNASYNYYHTKYSLREDLDTKYFNQQYGADVNWELPKNFYLSTQFTYSINSQRAEGFNTKVPLWNAAISRQFLRFNRGELKLSVFDLLNQNVGITRNTNQNYIEDVSTVNLQRYFMLSFTFSLSKNATGAMPAGNFRSIRH